HLSPAERTAATVYTSGEHCPMCAAAHAWVGLGRIVYASSTAQLTGWLAQWDVPAGPVAALPVHTVAPGIEVAGPDAELSARVRALQARGAGWDERRGAAVTSVRLAPGAPCLVEQIRRVVQHGIGPDLVAVREDVLLAQTLCGWAGLLLGS